jgi:hypothetical protein
MINRFGTFGTNTETPSADLLTSFFMTFGLIGGTLG